MAQDNTGENAIWERFYGPNLAYVLQLYDRYVQDPQSIDEETRSLFEQWGKPPTPLDASEQSTYEPETDVAMLQKVVAAENLVQNIRTYGHLSASLDPLVEEQPPYNPMLDPVTYELSERDLRGIPARVMWPEAPNHIANGMDVFRHLHDVYTGSSAYEFAHVHSEQERDWLTHQVEVKTANWSWSDEERIALLRRLTEVEAFEHFLHSTFPGQKRFSIEGLDMIVPMLDRMIDHGIHGGVGHVLIGMAHRGRLNVLAHVLGKPYAEIFSEFQHASGNDSETSAQAVELPEGRTGDVKYHKGAIRDIQGKDGTGQVRIRLAHNPSHLEYVSPVVLGLTRAAQEVRRQPGAPKQDVNRAFAILIHGDAAFPGEGIVQETLNLSGLGGYGTGGTIHIIANNQIGFTTDSSDARSTKYASDLAKAFEIPIVHVNADDPEACLQAVELACEYRRRFGKDFLIDLIGYRRFGHNEMDDPAVTQPTLYSKVDRHPSVRARYAAIGISQGWVSEQYMTDIHEDIQEQMKAAYDMMQNSDRMAKDMADDDTSADLSDHNFRQTTSVANDVLRRLNDDLLAWPDTFHMYPKLARILQRRVHAFDEGGKVDWAHAEALAFASLLRDGKPIRLTGQDTERGTFAHRNLILHDIHTGESWVPLQQLPESRASFAVYNSPLTEAAVLGFEYGYDVFAREALVLWEAQYGDFANAAQVIIDAFLAAGQAKWGQRSKLVLLLPHGYEGQGPEHSNARPERFLQLAAERNWTVAYPTSAAQYFHLLRRQALAGGKDRRPLIVMTPKGLLRNPRVASPAAELSEGSFRTIIEMPFRSGDEVSRPVSPNGYERIKRLILCTGKIAIDLETELESGEHAYGLHNMHLIRVEQLYPFPEHELHDVLKRCPALEEIVWVQEEPRNLGFWTYMEPRLQPLVPDGVTVRYIGRTDRSSPAEGRPDIHKIEQQRILREALTVSEGVSLHD